MFANNLEMLLRVQLPTTAPIRWWQQHTSSYSGYSHRLSQFI